MPSWVIYAIFSAIFAALVAILGKIGISRVDTILATTVRAVVMAVFLALVSLSLGKFDSPHSFGNKALVFIVLSGIAGALSWLFYFFALKDGHVAGVVALDRLSVVFVLIFAIIIFGDKLTWKSGLGAILVTTGAILMSLK
ncbi:MAG: hypothetical protein ACD_50C00204G0001 [uncultured bacterium]|nr:MAG: hypothetical protein ACD_50C00204G0001 [uncultured bacterium]